MTVARSSLGSLPRYAPRRLEGVDLDLRDCVNLWGAPPSARAAMHAIEPSRLAAYPEMEDEALVDAIAQNAGVRVDEVVTGCGSDDLLDAFLRSVAEPGERVALAAPSFAMVPLFARLSALDPVYVPLREDGSADVDALLATGARVTYLCSPNNPTGTRTSPAEIRRLVARSRGAVLVDEAYAEFAAGVDLRAEAPAMERVLVTRTLSKAWGLAGLRIGYGIGHRTLVEAVRAARGPYKVGVVAAQVAARALRDDEGWMRRSADAAIAERARLDEALRAPGLSRVRRVFDSHGNFVFLTVTGSAAELASAFQARGIGVRAFADLAGLGDALRIGVAPREMLDRVVSAAAEVLR